MDIPEKDKEGGENEPYPDVKQDQHADGVEQANEFPGEGDIVQDTKYKEHAEGQAKVDEGLDVF